MFRRLFRSEPVTYDTDTVGALYKLAFIALTIVVLICSTYVLPFISRLRPWIPGEAVPLARLFDRYEESILPSFAEANALAAPEARNEYTSNVSKVPSAATPAHLSPETKVTPEDIAGDIQPIEDPGDRALASFYRALLRTAQGKSHAVTRIAHYGDSAVAADSITSTMRRRLQNRFGDAGHGFVLISQGDMHYYHLDIYHRANDTWKLYPLVLGNLGADWYGYGGVQYRGDPGASARFATVDRGEIGKKVSRFEIFYQTYPGGGKILYRIDDGRAATIDTSNAEPKDAWHVIETTDNSHALSIRVAGDAPVRLYGVALERDVAGVVYDSLGMVSGRAERFLSNEREHIQRQISHRDPDLLILAFGGNEADNPWIDVARYEEKLRLVLSHLRPAGDQRACLLMSPLDQGERDGRGEIRTIPKLPEIVEAQRRVALSEGCAFFDTYTAMGGNGSMLRWYRKRPRLAMSDFRHATTAGYDVIGEMFYKALLKGYADYLQRQ
jgi:hypothetical protein